MLRRPPLTLAKPLNKVAVAIPGFSVVRSEFLAVQENDGVVSCVLYPNVTHDGEAFRRKVTAITGVLSTEPRARRR